MNPMDDGLSPATRADVNGVEANVMAVKADVESLRSSVKADIGRLDSSVRRLALEILDVRTELRELKEVVATKSDIKGLFDAVVSFAGKTQSYEAAKILHGQSLTDAHVLLKDHERRIKGLEDRPQ